MKIQNNKYNRKYHLHRDKKAIIDRIIDGLIDTDKVYIINIDDGTTLKIADYGFGELRDIIENIDMVMLWREDLD